MRSSGLLEIWLWGMCVIALAISPHSFLFQRLQHIQLDNYPYLSLLIHSQNTQQEMNMITIA
jgi:hypothetical protein